MHAAVAPRDGPRANHAYLLEKDKAWQKLFGPASLEYSESFRARPYSRASCAISTAIMPRAIRKKILLKRSRSGSRRISIGAINTRAGRRSTNSNMSMGLCDGSRGKPPLVFSKTKISEAYPSALAPDALLQTAAENLCPGISGIFRRRSAKSFSPMPRMYAGERAGRGVFARSKQ